MTAHRADDGIPSSTVATHQVSPPPTPTTELLLTRHGETVWHHDNRYAGGSSDIDLTDRGHAQAHALGNWAKTQDIDGIVCSPVRRARETAAPVATALDLPVHVLDGLREVDFGVAEGRTMAELLASDPDIVHRFRGDPAAHPFPRSEPPAVAAARAVAALRGIAERWPGDRVLVVAHNTLLRLALCQLIGIPVTRYRQVFPRLDNTAITRVGLDPDPGRPAALLALNVGIP
jgi:probable phosphoglycerate mutase